GISNVFSGVLNSFKRFLAYSFAPVFYNIGIILGAIFLVPSYGIYGLAGGVVLGSFFHMLIQLPAFLRTGFKYRPVVSFKHPGVRKIGRLMLPRTLGLAMTQINLWVVTMIASLQSEGSISIFNFANNLQSFPVGIFGVALSISCFPYLAEAFSQNDKVKFRDHFSDAFNKILFFVIPASMLLLVARAQIVRLVLGTGRFDWEDTYLTAQSLGYFAIGIFAQALIPLVARAFYAVHDTKTPVIISITSVIVNIVASLILVRTLGVMGLALAFSLAAFVNILLLLIMLRWKIGNLNDRAIVTSGFKIVLLSVVMAGVAYLMLQVMSYQVDMRTGWGIFMQAGVAALTGGVVYIGLAQLFKLKEVEGIREVLGMKK
ncbi:MAG: murein biosynthesis integral membrane protein MurJ, partial [Parcubacteria group bacterium]